MNTDRAKKEEGELVTLPSFEHRKLNERQQSAGELMASLADASHEQIELLRAVLRAPRHIQRETWLLVNDC